jgi:predicted nucleotide-binding protein
MAGKRGATSPPQIEVKRFTVADIDKGIAKLRRRIDEVSGLQEGVKHDDARVRNAETNIRETIRDVFGGASPEFHDHENDTIWRSDGGFSMYDAPGDYQRRFLLGAVDTKVMLEGLVARLEEKRSDLALEPPAPISASGPAARVPTDTRRVFLVHGHDEAAKHTVARFLGQLHLAPIVLSEQANEGRTIIEKFEAHSDVGFAVVLMTPDDEGCPMDTHTAPQPRARQNVVLELGYFLGKLGRKRVAVLYKESVELPSDYHGVIYTPMDEGDGWKLKLAKELRQAGMAVDLNDAL